MNVYVNRLLNEWKQHGKIIISVDFDDTIYPYNNNLENKEDIKRTIELIQLAKYIGAYIVIFTASPNDRHLFIQEYCDSIKIPVDSINRNPIDLPFGKEGKIYYNINLCDRSGLQESLNILEETIKLL